MFTRINYEEQEIEHNGKADIIAFYNDCYIVEMNLYVKNKCLSNPINGSGNLRPPTYKFLFIVSGNVFCSLKM